MTFGGPTPYTDIKVDKYKRVVVEKMLIQNMMYPKT